MPRSRRRADGMGTGVITASGGTSARASFSAMPRASTSAAGAAARSFSIRTRRPAASVYSQTACLSSGSAQASRALLHSGQSSSPPAALPHSRHTAFAG